MRTAVTAIVIALLACGAMVASAAPAGAATAHGCSGAAASLAKTGAIIDRASAPGNGATLSNPFDVKTDGSVRYHYDIAHGGRIATGHWKVSIDTGLVPITFGGDLSSSTKPS